MPDTEDNLEGIQPDALRSIKDTVLARIKRISNHPGTTDDKATTALRMRAWYDLLKHIDLKLVEFESIAS